MSFQKGYSHMKRYAYLLYSIIISNLGILKKNDIEKAKGKR